MGVNTYGICLSLCFTRYIWRFTLLLGACLVSGCFHLSNDGDYYSSECGKRREAGSEVVLCAGSLPQFTFTDPHNN